MRVKKTNISQKNENSQGKTKKLQRYNNTNAKRFTISSNMNKITDDSMKENMNQGISSPNNKNDINRSNKRNNKYKGIMFSNSNEKSLTKNISYVSFDGNKELSNSRARINSKKSPQIIYNRIQQRSPLKKDYKVYTIQNTTGNKDDESTKEENVFNKNKNKYLGNNINNSSQQSDYTPYISREDMIYQIIPQKAINIAFIQNNILAYNNKTINLNNNYYRINNTHSNFYVDREREREIQRERERENFRPNKDIVQKYRREISPQSEFYFQNHNNNNDNNVYNKTINTFYMHSNKPMFNKGNKTNNNSISKYEKNFSSNSKNSHHKKTKRSRRTIVIPDNDNIDNDNNSNIYKDYNDDCNDRVYNNSNDKKKMRKEFTDLDINNRTQCGDKYINDNLARKMKNRVITKEIYNNYKNDRNFNVNSNKSPKHTENGIMDESDITKVMIKKRPVINEYGKKFKTSNLNSSYDICQNISINFENKKKKYIFDNEESILDYINKKYEIEKKRRFFGGKKKYTGYVLSKKLKGKTIYDIRIEDEDINKINQALIEEQIKINNNLIQINYLNEENEQIIKSLEEQIMQYKEKNEYLSLNDNKKNELIKKLDSEKQNLIEEIKNISNRIEKVKELNMTLNEENQELKAKYRNFNKKNINNYIIENIFTVFFENEKNKEKFEDKKLKEEKMEINYITNNSTSLTNVSFCNNESKRKSRLNRLSRKIEIKDTKKDINEDK